MRDWFKTIDRRRQSRGDQPLHELLISILAKHERRVGTVKKILRAQSRLRRALGQDDVKLLLDYESGCTDRMIAGEVIAYNLGFEHGLAHALAETVDDPEVRRLAVELGELLGGRDVEDAAKVRALALVIAGVAVGEHGPRP